MRASTEKRLTVNFKNLTLPLSRSKFFDAKDEISSFYIRDSGGHIIARIWRNNKELGADAIHWVIEVFGLANEPSAEKIAKIINDELGRYLETIDIIVVSSKPQ